MMYPPDRSATAGRILILTESSVYVTKNYQSPMPADPRAAEGWAAGCMPRLRGNAGRKKKAGRNPCRAQAQATVRLLPVSSLPLPHQCAHWFGLINLFFPTVYEHYHVPVVRVNATICFVRLSATIQSGGGRTYFVNLLFS